MRTAFKRSRCARRRRLRLEHLERRTLLSVSPASCDESHDHHDEGSLFDDGPEPHIFCAVPKFTATGPYALPGAAAPSLTDVFTLHSNPGADHTIYLDFNGHTTSGTYWNSYYTNGQPFTTPAYDFNGNTGSFSSTELQRIEWIWERVAEDYIPFDVNVTTEFPGDAALRRTSSGDNEWGVRVVIGGRGQDWLGVAAGGVAFVGSFNWSSDTPVYVFEGNLGDGDEKFTAEAISHEAGHALGLSHDGRSSPNEEYYAGHGSGSTGWAPIMGNGYYRNLTQWSRGEYAGAREFQDDLAIISSNNGFSYRTDDHGDGFGSGSILQMVGVNQISDTGIIETNDDTDLFSFTAAAGVWEMDIQPASRGPNLDLRARLYDASQSLIATSNPSSQLGASLDLALAAGDYYLEVSGVGKGDPLSGGYSDYASLGQYSISGQLAINTSNAPPSINSSPPLSAVEDAAYLYAVAATDPDGDALLYSLDASPAGMTIDSQGTIRWNPTNDQVGVYSVAVTVTDPSDAFDTQSFLLSVENVNDRPTITTTALTSAVVGQGYVYDVDALDVDQGDSLTFGLDAAPAGMSIGASDGRIVWTPSGTQVGTHTVTVRVEDRDSAFDLQTFQLEVNAPSSQTAFGESGLVTVSQPDGETWHDVSFSGSYSDPVVVMGPISHNDSDPSTVRVRNVTATGFDYQIDEWGYSDGTHSTETIGYLVIESGSHQLSDGRLISAGRTRVDHDWSSVATPNAVGDVIVLAQVTTRAESSAVTPRIRNVTADGFEVSIQEEESSNNVHAEEDLDYIVWEVGTGLLGSIATEAGRTSNSVTHQVSTVSFTQSFSAPPVFLAAMQTRDGNDTAGLRSTTRSVADASFFVEEEASNDTETRHTTEVVGWLALAPGQFSNGSANQDPIADSSTQTTDEDQPILIALTASDADGDPLSYSITSSPTSGTLSGSGDQRTYSPAADFFGQDSFSFRVEDGRGGSDVATVSIDVLSVNDAPVITSSPPDRATAGQTYRYTMSVTDPDVGEDFTFSLDAAPAGMTIDSTNGEIVWTPTAGQAGTHTVSARVEDSGAAFDLQAYSVTVAPSSPSRIGESGSVTVSQSSGSDWHSVSFQESYLDPIVVMGPVSFNGGNPSAVRVRNVSGSGFEFQIDEWDYLDGSHTTETIGYLAIESGTHTMADGAQITAGRASIDHRWSSIAAPGSAEDAIVLAQVVSQVESSAVTTRLRNVTASGFQIKLQEEEASDGIHAAEEVAWIVWDSGVGMFGSTALEAARTTNSVTHNSTTVSFDQDFGAPPVFLAALQTYDGGDTAGLRTRSVSSTGATFFVEEEASRDSETSHTTEVVGYLALAAGPLRAVEPADYASEDTATQLVSAGNSEDELFAILERWRPARSRRLAIDAIMQEMGNREDMG